MASSRKLALQPVIFAALTLALSAQLGCSNGSAAARSDAGDDATSADDAGSFGPDFDPLASDAAIAMRVDRLFRTTCAGGPESFCHGASAGSVRLSIAPDGGDLVGVRAIERPDLFRVEPSAPERSYVYLKVIGDGGIEGGRMPLGDPNVDPRLPALVRAWIESGAPPNTP